MPDFNGDGRDDILWWSQTTGYISNWLGREDGGFRVNDANALTYVNAGSNWYWEIHAFADFNGDGRDDILWISDGGELSNWLGTETGGFAVNDPNAFNQVPSGSSLHLIADLNGDGQDDLLWWSGFAYTTWLGTDAGGFAKNVGVVIFSSPQPWNISGSGDFNGDGRYDLLWRNVATGEVSTWLGTPSGNFAVNDANALQTAPTNWFVIAIADFNGDGRDDLLWHNTTNAWSNWLGTEAGGFAVNDANALTTVPTNWWVHGVGDFNGDGRDDLMWRNDAGQISNWLSTENGGWLVNDANALRTAPANWFMSGIGDYDGDGRCDILWRNNNGDISTWLGTETGGWLVNDAAALAHFPPGWDFGSYEDDPGWWDY